MGLSNLDLRFVICGSLCCFCCVSLDLPKLCWLGFAEISSAQMTLVVTDTKDTFSRDKVENLINHQSKCASNNGLACSLPLGLPRKIHYQIPELGELPALQWFGHVVSVHFICWAVLSIRTLPFWT